MRSPGKPLPLKLKKEIGKYGESQLTAETHRSKCRIGKPEV